LSSFLNITALSEIEQIQYSERLIHFSLFFIIPFTIIGFSSLFKYLNKKHIFLIYLTIIFAGIIIGGSFYLLYPQRNPIVHFPGYNVTATDYEVADYLYEQAGEYVVLSNILTAAASIEKYGYIKYYPTDEGLSFYFSIPSGSRLAELYYKMLYDGQKREFMQKAMDFAGVDMAYFLIHTYWHNSSGIIEGAKQSADGWEEINSQIWIFKYSR